MPRRNLDLRPYSFIFTRYAILDHPLSSLIPVFVIDLEVRSRSANNSYKSLIISVVQSVIRDTQTLKWRRRNNMQDAYLTITACKFVKLQHLQLSFALIYWSDGCTKLKLDMYQCDWRAPGTGLSRMCILDKYGVLVLHQSWFIFNCCCHTNMVKLFSLKFGAVHDDEIDLNHLISLQFISFIISYFMFHDFCFYYCCDSCSPSQIDTVSWRAYIEDWLSPDWHMILTSTMLIPRCTVWLVLVYLNLHFAYKDGFIKIAGFQ